MSKIGIIIIGGEISQIVQKLAINYGYNWYCGNGSIMNYNFDVLFLNDKELTHSNLSYAIDQNIELISAEEFILYHKELDL